MVARWESYTSSRPPAVELSKHGWGLAGFRERKARGDYGCPRSEGDGGTAMGVLLKLVVFCGAAVVVSPQKWWRGASEALRRCDVNADGGGARTKVKVSDVSTSCPQGVRLGWEPGVWDGFLC